MLIQKLKSRIYLGLVASATLFPMASPALMPAPLQAQDIGVTAGTGTVPIQTCNPLASSPSQMA